MTTDSLVDLRTRIWVSFPAGRGISPSNLEGITEEVMRPHVEYPHHAVEPVPFGFGLLRLDCSRA